MNLLHRESKLYNEMAEILKGESLSDDRILLLLSDANARIREGDDHLLSVAEINKLILNCKDCYGKGLCTEHGPVVGRGTANSEVTDIFFIGLMPGETEEKTGSIFTGPNSKVLLEHMASLGIGGKDCPVYAHNLVCCMPLSKVPKVEQTRNCSLFLAELLYVLQPNIVVTLGAKALSFILGKDVKLEDYEGEVLMQGRYIVVPIKHPSALHRIPDEIQRREAFGGYRTQLAGIKRMNDRIKKLRASGELRERGTLAMFDVAEDKDEQYQFILQEMQE